MSFRFSLKTEWATQIDENMTATVSLCRVGWKKERAKRSNIKYSFNILF
jgi:hypothetical protein